MATNNYVELFDSKFINISGEDSKDFLQGLITNDINKCNSKNPIYSCLLTPQGKFIADFFIIEFENNFLIEIDKKFNDDFLNRLNIYKLRSKISINKNNDYISLVIFEKKQSSKFSENIISFEDPRSKNLGLKIYIKKNNYKELMDNHNLEKINFDNYKELLINNLVPYGPDDLKINNSLLLENNFDNLNAIDWEKGCYVGQEITARMKYRALLKKKIYALKIIEGETKPSIKIFVENKNIGQIISNTKKLALAMLNIEEAKKVSNNNKTLKTENAKLEIIY
tara:strand:+ start:396 stop:1241 length:846 start_codon:yes stop_codon:yes gene_type:complete